MYPIYIENERLLIHRLEKQDLDSLISMRSDRLVYRYEPVFLAERQDFPEEALESLRILDLYENKPCIANVYTFDCLRQGI